MDFPGKDPGVGCHFLLQGIFHCPTGAIQMVPWEEGKNRKGRVPKIPVINTERCIGCGACENLCPSRPFSAIYVEGHERHCEI